MTDTHGSIVEISPWQYYDVDPPDFDKLRGQGVTGVIIKSTQGDNWTGAHVPEATRGAVKAGLMVGALHYGVPGRSDPTVEGDWALGNLPPAPLALGLIVELSDFGGQAPYMVGGWCEALLQRLTLGDTSVAVMVEYDKLDELQSYPWGARRVYAFGSGDETTGGWAIRWPGEDFDGLSRKAASYNISSMRGINPPSIAPTFDREPVRPLTVDELATAVPDELDGTSTWIEEVDAESTPVPTEPTPAPSPGRSLVEGLKGLVG